MEPERQDVRLRGSPTRCPYCHDDVAEEEFAQARVCGNCLARHHSDCWEGACAACGADLVLGEVSVRAKAPERALGTSYYERGKRLLNWSYVAGWILSLVSTFGAAFWEISQGLPPESEPPLLLMIPILCLALLCYPVFFTNLYDAVVRYQRDSKVGVLPVVFAATGLCTAGLSSFGYYLRWGWAPLPPKAGRVRRRTVPAKRGLPGAGPDAPKRGFFSRLFSE